MKKITFIALTFFVFSLNSYAQSPCDYSIDLIDSFGDGWNGNTLDVLVDGNVVLDDITLASGSSESVALSGVADGQEITTVWNGGGSFGFETSYSILNNVGVEVGSASQADITTAIVVVCQVPPTAPNCASNPMPMDGAMNQPVGTTTLTWDAPTTGPMPTSYDLFAGAMSDGSDFGLIGNFTTNSADVIVNGFDTTIFYRVIPKNSNVSAEMCPIWSFTTQSPPQGALCTNALTIMSLPYTETAGTTDGFGDDYSGANVTCSPSSTSYLSGDDIVYEYTPVVNQIVNINLTNTDTWVGVYVFTGCDASPDVFTGCIADDNNNSAGNPEIESVSLIGGTTYYIVISTFPNPQSTVFDLSITEITCAPPIELGVDITTATTADLSWTSVNSPIETSWEYVVQTPDTGEPTMSGTATTSNPVSISNLVDGNSYEFYVRANCEGDGFSNWAGPFAWDQILPPSNNNCSGAIGLTVGFSYEDNATDGTVTGATVDTEPNACGTNGPGVWYSVVVPTNGNLTIETGPDAATGDTGFDSLIEIFSGSCGMLTSIECDDDDGPGLFSFLELTGLTPGETLYIRVWESGGNEDEPFSISAYNPLPNDECSNSEPITLGTEVTGNNTGATDSGVTTDCFSGNIRDLWYAFDATATGEVYISGVTTGFQYGVYSDCTGTQVGTCNTSPVTGLVDGDTYYIRISDDGTGAARASGVFAFTASEAALSTGDFDDKANFSYYPNPVKNTLNLNAQQNIENVTMYNMLGQQVMQLAPNTINSEVDMSGLISGTYFVKVTILGNIETVRVIKQ